jgi:hypothetical protein
MAIIKFDINGKYVAIYHTITEASEGKKSDVGNIHKCVNGILDKINGNYFISIDNPTESNIDKIQNLLSEYVKIKNEKMANLIKNSMIRKKKIVELEEK